MEYALEVLKKKLRDELCARAILKHNTDFQDNTKQETEAIWESVMEITERILSLESAIKKLEG